MILNNATERSEKTVPPTHITMTYIKRPEMTAGAARLPNAGDGIDVDKRILYS